MIGESKATQEKDNFDSLAHSMFIMKYTQLFG